MLGAVVIILITMIAISISFVRFGLSLPIKAYQAKEGYAICQKIGEEVEEFKGVRFYFSSVVSVKCTDDSTQELKQQ